MRWDLVYLAVGAVLGAFLRYRITGEGFFLGSLPVSVLIVNVVGSFILGISAAVVSDLGLDSRYTLLVGIGFCGSFTTMSSFAYETANALEVGELVLAGANVLLNVGASIGAVLLGRAIVLMLLG